MQHFIRKSYFYFLISAGLINTIAITLLLTALSFAFHDTLHWWHFPLSVLLAFLVNFYASKYFFGTEYLAIFIRSTTAILLVTVVSIGIAMYFYDLTYDGQQYHQEAIYQFKTGWNPFYSVLPKTVNQSIWINHYGRGAELPQAVIYSFTNRIESGKATNMMLALASFFLCLSALYKMNKLSSGKKILFSLLMAFNPFVINQLITYYVDGQVSSLLLCLFALSCLLFFEVNRYYLFLLASAIIITVNVKFTAVFYAVVFIAALLLILYYYKKQLKHVFLSALAAGLIGICFVGFNPYITNTLKYHHPFYPLMGKGSVDIMTYNMPYKGFENKNRFEKLFISLFSHTDNIAGNQGRKPTLKLPFTIDKNDVVNASKVDTRIGGNGPMFTGMLLLALILALIIRFKYKGRYNLGLALFLIGVILFTVFMIAEAWWARYLPQLWFVPFIIIFIAEEINSKWVKRINILFYLCVLLNLSFCLIAIPWNIFNTEGIRYQLAQLKASGKTIDVEFGNNKSNRVRFYENNIRFREVKFGKDEPVVYVVRSDTRYRQPNHVDHVEKPYILKWSQAIGKFIKK